MTAADNPLPTTPEAATREVSFEHSTDLVPFLAHYGISLLISTYQAGKLAVVSAWQDKLRLAFHNFDQPMGVAARPERIAIGVRGQVWQLNNAPDIAPRIEPALSHDAAFVTRTSHVTGEIHSHDMAWAGDELWVVNTLFSCLCTLHPQYSFVPRWRPPFISALAAEDRCHLNGLALDAEGPKYVTALGQTDVAQGWRPGKATGGLLIDVNSSETVLTGLAMPHSPRIHEGRLWLLDSGTGRLVLPDLHTGQLTTVAELPGYTRGLSFFGPYAFVGLSRIRETSTFGGLPIAERRADLKCGVWVVDCRSGRVAVFLEFKTGVEEIFDVQVLSGIRNPILSGPSPAADGAQAIWIVPGGRPEV